MSNTVTYKNILIIDDDQFQLDWLQDILNSNHYSVLVADNANKAETLCREEQVDLVITDVLMPEKDGIEMIMWLKNHDDTIPIIAISGGGMVDGVRYLKSAEMLGADRILSKPLIAEDLISAVSDLLSQN